MHTFSYNSKLRHMLRRHLQRKNNSGTADCKTPLTLIFWSKAPEKNSPRGYFIVFLSKRILQHNFNSSKSTELISHTVPTEHLEDCAKLLSKQAQIYDSKSVHKFWLYSLYSTTSLAANTFSFSVLSYSSSLWLYGPLLSKTSTKNQPQYQYHFSAVQSSHYSSQTPRNQCRTEVKKYSNFTSIFVPTGCLDFCVVQPHFLSCTASLSSAVMCLGMHALHLGKCALPSCYHFPSLLLTLSPSLGNHASHTSLQNFTLGMCANDLMKPLFIIYFRITALTLSLLWPRFNLGPQDQGLWFNLKFT